MKLSLWMVYNTLKEFDPIIYIKDKELRTIENVRLFIETEGRFDHILYVEAEKHPHSKNNEHIVCSHGNNYILLNTGDINRVFNTVLTYFEDMMSWEQELNSMLSGHCLLNDLLNHFSKMLLRPIMVLDSSQVVLAHSSDFGMGTLDDSWDQMLKTGSFGINTIAEYNRLYKYMTTKKDAYLIPANPFAFPSISRNIFENNEFIGYITMIAKGESLEQSERDWFDVACEAVFSWFSLYTDNNDITMRQKFFTDILRGDMSNKERFIDILNAQGWEKDATKRLLVLSCLSSHVNMNQHVARIMNQIAVSIYAITFENKIVALINESEATLDEYLKSFLPLLHSSGYYGGRSNPFTDLSELKDQLEVATIALENAPAAPGVISDGHDYVLPYIFSTLKNHMKLELCHPAVIKLRDYDAEHNTDNYKVLYTYLQNNCNQTVSAKLLNLHRNSMIRKIARIEEICNIDLTDYEVRLHLTMSFEYERYLAHSNRTTPA